MRKRKHTLESLAPIVAVATSYAEILRALGLQPTGGNYRQIQQRIREYNIDTSHLSGQGWSRNKTSATDIRVKLAAEKRSYTDSKVFVENSPVLGGTKLRKRLLRLGRPYACNVCKISEWLHNPLVLHIDHINGISNDNRLDNLRFLCPNCHQQTETWGSKKNASVA